MTIAVQCVGASVSDAELRHYVQQRKADIFGNGSSMSMRATRRLLESDLGLRRGTLDARHHKASVAALVGELLNEVEEPPPSKMSREWSALPSDLLLEVLACADDATLHVVRKVCRKWRAAGHDEALWKQRFEARLAFLALDDDTSVPTELAACIKRLAELAEELRRFRGRVEPTTGGPEPPDTWEGAYQQLLRLCCVECGSVGSRKTLLAAPCTAVLCKCCSSEHDRARPGQLLISATEARHQFRLPDDALQQLPFVLVVNPIHPNFAAMRLYMKLDVREAAVLHWGGVEGMLAHCRIRSPC